MIDFEKQFCGKIADIDYGHMVRLQKRYAPALLPIRTIL
jgi:hypothetical protein